MEQVLQNIAQTVEKQLDGELERLNQLDPDDIEHLRAKRLAELKKRSQMKQEWLANGHGQYSELADEKEFFDACNKSSNVVCHFYKSDSMRCKIVDEHLKILAPRHVETRFIKLDVERAPFLTTRLKVRVIPTLALVKDSKTKDYVVGFSDVGNCDDFSTEMLEWRIARAEVIDYQGDVAVPPAVARKQRQVQAASRRTIRSRADQDDSDLELSD